MVENTCYLFESALPMAIEDITLWAIGIAIAIGLGGYFVKFLFRPDPVRLRAWVLLLVVVAFVLLLVGRLAVLTC